MERFLHGLSIGLALSILGCAREQPGARAPHDGLRPWVTASGESAPRKGEKDRDGKGQPAGDPITTPFRAALPSDSLFPGGKPCLEGLKSAEVAYRATDTTRGVDTPVVIQGPIGGVQFWSRGGPLVADCRLALALSELAPKLRKLGVLRVRFSGAYAYRMSRKGRLSLHAYGLAMDVHEVSTRDQTYSVEKDYARSVGESCDSGVPLLNRLACELRATGAFRELLTPNYNADHRDHFHLGIAPLPTSESALRAAVQASKLGLKPKSARSKSKPVATERATRGTKRHVKAPKPNRTDQASATRIERATKNRLGKASAKVEASRQGRNDAAVDVSALSSREGVARLRADLENLAQVTRDALHRPSTDQSGKLLPIEAK